jgi:hypothetical protein
LGRSAHGGVELENGAWPHRGVFSAQRDILLLRLQALLARAHGDAAAYAHFRDRYRDMVRTLGFEGHIAWAEAIE